MKNNYVKVLKGTVFVVDVDGILTDGKMYYTAEGKWMKAFGCDDWDALKILQKYMKLSFVTADKKGFPIVRKRMNEMGFELNLVSHLPKERWDWIKDKYPDYYIYFMGDGVFDFYALEKADYSFTTEDALDNTKHCASVIIKRGGADRAVAEACLEIFKQLKIDWKKGLI